MTFDAKPSVRTKDENGFLKVQSSHLSKANVCPYWWNEVPDWEKHGLTPNKIYYGFRAPAELAKAAHTFEGLPLLMGHHVESADDPQKFYRIGSIGSSVTFEDPYLDGALYVTDSSAIRMIEDGEAREISCAYMYDPVFAPGEYDGHHYDFVMTNIRGNHVALVPEGRAGSDVVVADEKMKPLERNVTMLDSIKDARDAMSPEEHQNHEQKEVDLARQIIDMHKVDPATGKVVEMNEDADKVATIRSILDKLSPEERKELSEALDGVCAAKDAEPKPEPELEVEPEAKDLPDFGKKDEPEAKEERKADDADPITPSEAIENVKDDPKPAPKSFEKKDAPKDLPEPKDVAEAEAKEDEEEAKDKAPVPPFLKAKEKEAPKPEPKDEDAEEEFPWKAEAKQAADACGMDGDSPIFQKGFAAGVKFGKGREKKDEGCAKAAMDAAIAKSKADLIAEFKEKSRAVEAVRSVIGNVEPMAFDSADDVYGAALKAKGVDVSAHPRSAWRSMFEMLGTASAPMAQDSAPDQYVGVFAGLNRINIA